MKMDEPKKSFKNISEAIVYVEKLESISQLTDPEKAVILDYLQLVPRYKETYTKIEDLSTLTSKTLASMLIDVIQPTPETTPPKEVIERGEKIVEENKELKEKITADVKAETKRREDFWANYRRRKEEGEKFQVAKKEAAAKTAQQPQPTKVDVKEKIQLPEFVVAPEAKKPGPIFGEKEVIVVPETNIVYAVATTKIEPIKLAQSQIIKARELQHEAITNPQGFIDSFVKEATKTENLPPGINPMAAKIIATETAIKVVSDLSLLDINTLSKGYVPKPNKLIAEHALVMAQGPQLGQAVQRTVAGASIIDSIARRTAVSFGLEPEIISVLFGPQDQKFEIVKTKPDKPPSEWVALNIGEIEQSAYESSVGKGASFAQLGVDTLVQNFPQFPLYKIPGAINSLTDLFDSISPDDLGNSIVSDASIFMQWAPEFVPGLPSLEISLAKIEVSVLGEPYVVGLGFNPFGGFGVSFAPAAPVVEAGAGTAVATGAEAATAATGVAAATEATAVGTAAGTVVGEGAAVAAAGTGAAAGTSVGAVAGSVIPVIGTILGALAGLILAALPAISKWFKEHSDDFAAVFIGGGIFGLMIGNVFLAAGGLGVGVPLAISGGGIQAALGSIGAGIGALFTGAILPALARPLIGFLIGFPVLVALILFIINSGAYVVPPGTGIGPGGGIIPGANVAGTCPIPNQKGELLCGSYGSGNYCEHGTNSYWSTQTSNCAWGLPSSDGVRCTYNQIPGSVCYNANPPNGLCADYGYAADFKYPGFNNSAPHYPCGPNAPVIFPSFDGKILDWNYVRAFSGTAGENGIFSATDGTHVYEMYVTHLSNIPRQGAKSNDPMGYISCVLEYPHIHIEVKIDGQYIRPDNLCP